MRPPIPRPPEPPEDPFDEKPRLKIQYVKDDGGAGPVAVGVIAGLLVLAFLFSMCSCTTSFDASDQDAEQDTDEDIATDIAGDGDAEVPEVVDDSCDDCGDIAEDGDEDAEEDADPCDLYPTWYRDGDMDGWGRDGVTVCSPTQPEGYVARGGDCCDSRNEVHPGSDEWRREPYACPGESWDWNCDGTDEVRWPGASHDRCDPFCGHDCNTVTDEEECDSTVWWEGGGTPACGEGWPVAGCYWGGANCVARGSSGMPQQCR